MSKATNLEINIRPNLPRGYVISVYRPAAKRNLAIPSNSELYVANNIEEVESMVAQLLRKGKVT